ncbi:hypothetical protein [Streptomyces vastus]|uniref:DUF3618 domain-containing protein n=1 Tax=Streptomyces vastus TaxID=285451 RepID=A0ABP6D0F5_9ACTN
MAVMTQALAPALEDARQTHAAVADRFRADVTVTPPGPYRQMLERQVAEVLDSLQRIEHHLRETHPRGLLGSTVDMAGLVTRSAMRTAMLPLAIGSSLVTGLLGGRQANELRLLKNSENEFTAAARALAASRAGESIAEEIQDQAAADLLGSLRRQDQELLEKLEDSVAAHARAVVAAGNGFGPQHEGSVRDELMHVVRTTADRLRDIVQTGSRQTRSAAEGVVREMPGVTRMAEEVQGAVTREEDLPIAGYGRLGLDETKKRLRPLSQSDLTVIEGYERAHANRDAVLDTIEQLRGGEPWPGYDTMDPSEIMAQLQNVSLSVAREVAEYEQRHRRREPVISTAQARIPL